MIERYDCIFVGVGHFCYRAANYIDGENPSAWFPGWAWQNHGVADNRGVIVDDHMRTSDPHIYCGGDTAEFPTGVVSQKESAASHQGEIAAQNALGSKATVAAREPMSEELVQLIQTGASRDVTLRRL